jgi:hypothetical protein
MNDWLIDWLIWSKKSYNGPWPTYIYRSLDIALFMNQRILTKYDENLYLDLSLIRENRTLWLPIPKPLVLQTRASSKYHNFLIRALNHALHRSILIVSMRTSSWMFQIFGFSSYFYRLEHFIISSLIYLPLYSIAHICAFAWYIVVCSIV